MDEERVGNHPPNPDCSFCHGTGQKYVKKHDRHYPCICLFADHEHSDELGEMLAQTAGKIRREMFGGNT